jgi:DNA-binding transcriptional ArsR family regulator
MRNRENVESAMARQLRIRRERRAAGDHAREDIGGPRAVGFFQALQDPTRLAILLHLLEQPGLHTVTDIASSCTVSLSVVSRHLRQLSESGILRRNRSGKEVFYSVNREGVVDTLRRIADAIESCHGRSAS